jgi:hypothetical protein
VEPFDWIVLAGYDLSDAQIVDFAFTQRREILKVVLRPTYDQHGNFLRDSDERTLTLEFITVQEVRIRNGLSTYMLTHPEEVSDGLEEIGGLGLARDSTLLADYAWTPFPLHHFAFVWDSTAPDPVQRQIDIVCADLRATLPRGAQVRPLVEGVVTGPDKH